MMMGLRHITVVDHDDRSNVMTANVYVPTQYNRDKRTIVLLPFWGGYADIFQRVQVGLAETCPDNATIAVSYRGTGRAINKELDVDHRQFAISIVSRHLLNFLQSEAIASLVDTSHLILCGHSWSTKVAFSFFSRDAPRAGISVSSLVLIGPSPLAPMVLAPEDREYRRSAYNTIESAKFTIENVLAHQKLSHEEVDGLAHNMVSMSVAAKKSWIEVGIWEDWTRDIQEFVAENPHMLIPIHVISADRDKVEPAPQVEKQTVDILRRFGFPVSYENLKDTGHLIPIERPEAVTKGVQVVMGL